MCEYHDNSRPSKTGSLAISEHGVISYFPIEQATYKNEEAAFMKSMTSLILVQRADGELTAQLDMRMDDIGESVLKHSIE